MKKIFTILIFTYLAYEDIQRVAKQVSLFPIIPSISYEYNFNYEKYYISYTAI